jgi:hypothetical protein
MWKVVIIIVLVVSGCTPRVQFVEPGDIFPGDGVFAVIDGPVQAGQTATKYGIFLGSERDVEAAVNLPANEK